MAGGGRLLGLPHKESFDALGGGEMSVLLALVLHVGRWWRTVLSRTGNGPAGYSITGKTLRSCERKSMMKNAYHDNTHLL